MKMNRRVNAGFWILTMLVFVFGSTGVCLGALNQDEFLKNGTGKFAVDIPGCPTASANIQSVQVEDLTIDARDTTLGVDWDFRTYAPGDAHYGKATFRSRVGKNSKELLQWLQDASDGKDACKNIAIILRDRKGREARRFNLMECFPIKYDPGDYSGRSIVRTESIVVEIGSVEFASGPAATAAGEDTKGNVPVPGVGGVVSNGAYYPDALRLARGFRLDVTGQAVGKSEDNAWETCTGGALCIEVAPASTGANCHQVATPGQKFVEEIQLRGPMTAGRKWIVGNINDVANKHDSRFDITITELNPAGKPTGKTYTYMNCFIIRYVYPKLSADDHGTLQEEVIIKAERLEIL